MSDSRSDKILEEKLIDALRKGDYTTTCALIKECKDINAISARPLLEYAVDARGKSTETLCHIENLFDLLITSGIDLHKNKNGDRALLVAVNKSLFAIDDPLIRKQHFNIIDKLLDKKVDVDAELGAGKDTALHLATWTGDEEKCRFLIARGASLNAICTRMFHDAPIATALYHDQSKLAEALIEIATAAAKEKKADLTAALGNSVLSVIKTKEQLPTLKKLLFLKANVNAQDTLQRTALHYIARNVSPYDNEYSDHDFLKELISLLANAGIDPMIKDEEGQTALQSAGAYYCKGHEYCIKLLHNLENRTPLANTLTSALEHTLFPPLINIVNKYAFDLEEEMRSEERTRLYRKP